MVAQRRGQVLAKTPAVRRAVVVDHAHLIVAEPIDAIFIEEESGVLDEKVAHFRFAEIKDQPAGVSAVGEVERIPVPARGRLPIEEVNALVAEIAARMVVNHVQQDSESVQMAEIDQGLQLVHLSAQISDLVRRQTLRLEERVYMGDIRWQVRILDGKIHLGRKIIHAVVTEAELRGELLDRHELDRRESEAGEMRNLARDVEKRSRFGRQVRSEKYADMQLIDHEIVEPRRDVSGLVPRKVRLADDAIARERSRQLPRKRIALRTRPAITDHEKLVTVAILHSRQKAAPMALFVAGQQVCVISDGAVDTGVNALRVGRPNPEGCALVREVRSHRRVVPGMVE